MNWIQLDVIWVQFFAFEKMLLKLRVPLNVRNFVSNESIIVFS